MTLELALELLGALVGGVVSTLGAIWLRRQRKLRAMLERAKELKVTLPKSVGSFEEDVFREALLEQARREKVHQGPKLRPEQRVRMVQQRLSRKWGEYAFAKEVLQRIHESLGVK